MISVNRIRKTFHVLAFCLCLIYTGAEAQVSGNQKCDRVAPKRGHYKLIFEAVEPDRALLDIVIKPSDFNTVFLTALAGRLRNDYCGKKRLVVSIFDQKKDAVGWNYDYVVSHGKEDRRRGTYLLDRASNVERFEYSKNKGGPISEITLNIPNP